MNRPSPSLPGREPHRRRGRPAFHAGRDSASCSRDALATAQTVDDVVRRYLEARGGIERLRAVQTLRLSGHDGAAGRAGRPVHARAEAAEPDADRVHRRRPEGRSGPTTARPPGRSCPLPGRAAAADEPRRTPPRRAPRPTSTSRRSSTRRRRATRSSSSAATACPAARPGSSSCAGRDGPPRTLHLDARTHLVVQHGGPPHGRGPGRRVRHGGRRLPHRGRPRVPAPHRGGAEGRPGAAAAGDPEGRGQPAARRRALRACRRAARRGRSAAAREAPAPRARCATLTPAACSVRPRGGPWPGGSGCSAVSSCSSPRWPPPAASSRSSSAPARSSSARPRALGLGRPGLGGVARLHGPLRRARWPSSAGRSCGASASSSGKPVDRLEGESARGHRGGGPGRRRQGRAARHVVDRAHRGRGDARAGPALPGGAGRGSHALGCGPSRPRDKGGSGMSGFGGAFFVFVLSRAVRLLRRRQDGGGRPAAERVRGRAARPLRGRPRRGLPHPRALRRRDPLPARPQGAGDGHPGAGLHHQGQRAGGGRRDPVPEGDGPRARVLRDLQLQLRDHPARPDDAAQRDRQDRPRPHLRGAHLRQHPGGDRGRQGLRGVGRQGPALRDQEHHAARRTSSPRWRSRCGPSARSAR